MPLYDYHCTACDARFELLVRSTSTPACPHCGSVALDRLLSLPAPQGQTKAIIRAGRQAAAREGHFSHYSKAERAKLLK